MFTGLVEDLGTIARIDRRSDAAILVISPAKIVASELVLGESVAVNGVCLTVTKIEPGSGNGRFTALAGAETLRRTTLGELRPQSKVNLERALRVGDRLGGHIVAGHVDGVGQVTSRRDLGSNLEIIFRAPAEVIRYVIEKGSIAIDGISLTVNRVEDYGFAIALIPHTVDHTTLANKAVGSKVNLEVDMIGKYVEKLVGGYVPAGPGTDSKQGVLL